MSVEQPNVVDTADFDVLPIAVLKVDDFYQRPLRMRVVNEIADDYDLNAAGLIVVSERPPLPGMKDPRYYIVDGQHRAKAAAKINETEILCKVIRFKGGEPRIRMQEAQLRGKLGTRKADTPMERFKHQLAAGNDESIAISQVVQSYGGEISLNPNSSKGLNSISALEEIYRRGRLDAVLRLIKTGWDTFDGRAGESATLKAFDWLVAKHADLDREHLTRRMRGLPPEALYARASAIRAGMGGSMWKNVYRALLEVYNTRIPAKVHRLVVVEF